MDVIALPVGQAAAAGDDCIKIQQLPDGRFALEGSVLVACGDGDAVESVSLIGSDPYPSADAAEAAGIAWANEHCVELLHVSRSDGTNPLPDAA